MHQHADYGKTIAEEWNKVISETILKECYPANHPISKVTSSLLAKYPTGVYVFKDF